MKQLCVVFPDGGFEMILNMGFIRKWVTVKSSIRVGRETIPYLKDLDLNTWLHTRVWRREWTTIVNQFLKA